MDRRAKALFIVLLFLISASLPAISQQVPASRQASKVVFLEHYMSANGTIIQGEAPFRSVNFPTYWYNENTKQINGKVDFPINTSLKMVFGDVLTLQGNFGEGTGNKLYGVYSFPVNADQAYIYGIDMDGNVVMRLNQRAIILKPGDSYSYSENETLKDHGATIEVEYNHTYMNHGYIDKNNILQSP
ncbi:MAG TPA: hypothetical protein VMC84_02780 [Methanocella sp.]|uniref:hypothetical protein n=1 Tax=Methanocella sp. TaxID=2052833 RepID=UPI002D176750|nr:hypothetical protein [Methanocella sp.]HTY90078.1 hypothetical protein [Methanocella sp.]